MASSSLHKNVIDDDGTPSPSSSPPPPLARTQSLPPAKDGLPQTGPKGVLTDYYRKLEEDKKLDILAKKSRHKLIMQHSATVQPYSEERAEATAMANVAKALEDGSLAEDPFIMRYRAQRIEELKSKGTKSRNRFGHLVEIRGDKYDTLIDKSPPGVLVIIHIYSDFYKECVDMNRCLTRLAKLYPTAKFCRVQCSNLGVSQSFAEKALPTVIVYCDGEVVGNHVRITDNLNSEYTEEDVETFLQEKNCLPPEIEKEGAALMGGPSRSAVKILGHKGTVGSDTDSD